MRFSRWLIILILFLSIVSLASPAQSALTYTISAVDWTSTTSQMGAYLVNRISVTSSGTGTTPNAVTLYLSDWYYGSYYGSYYGLFSPNPLTFTGPGQTKTSTLTIPLPDPNDLCPGQQTPYALTLSLRVEGRDSGGSTIVGPTLEVNLLPTYGQLTVHIVPTKTSYMKGETVTLNMDSNLPAQYYLTVKKPDGTEWATAQGKFTPLSAVFSKPAADPLGTYTAQVTAIYCGSAQATATFTITPDTYDITISLAGLITNSTTTLTVDGSKAATMSGGDVKVLSYPIGSSHTFQVDQYVTGATGYRYYCASNSWTANAAGSNVFNYATQVYLDVSLEPTGITDVMASGWFAKGTTASISAVPAEIGGMNGTKYVFTAWTVDGTQRSSNGFALVMDAPHTIVAKFDTTFLLTVVSEYGNPTGSGYYKSGETATFSVTSPVGFGMRDVFVEWKGDYVGKNPNGSIIMDGPKTVTAVWTKDYFQIYLIVAGIGTVVAVVAVLLLLMRRRREPSAVKPPPPPPPPPETSGTSVEAVSAVPETETAPKRPVSIALRCTNCGHKLKQGQVFCPECGQKQTD